MSGVRKFLARLREDVVALIYPPQCLLCFDVEVSEPVRFLCEPCWLRMQNDFLPAVRDSKLAFCDFDLAAWHYRGAMDVLIPQMKYQNTHPSFAKIFGELAAQRTHGLLRPYLSARSILVPVPLHPVRERERGFNQSELIARSMAAQWGLELWPRALRRTRYTQQQAKLSLEDRLRNVEQAFAPRRSVSFEGRAVILVDDVITTGATISACAGVIKEAGATSVGAIALARGGGAI
ncbi:MAG: ComF family protein [candidate division KSB1 bacterium]